MNDRDYLAQQFEAQRTRLRSVAYRMLGSLSEAEDAVQEAWLRCSQADTDEIENMQAWLTTIVARISLNVLRSRNVRPEAALDPHVPDPLVSPADGPDPEQQALVADAVGLALQVVLDTLGPAERLAFVLHDMFEIPFEQIAPIVGRSPTAARQLASRARRRIRGQAPVSDSDLITQRRAVDAFFAAAHDGEFDRLVAVLDPDVALRSDGGALRSASSVVIHGAEAVAARAMTFARFAPYVRPALVNGAAGVVVADGDQIRAVIGFTVVGGLIVEVNALSDPERLSQLDLGALVDG